MIITKTPLRISLFGGGSDLPWYLNEATGLTLSFTINKYIYVILKKRHNKTIRLSYSETETTRTADELKHGIVRSALQLFDNAPDTGLEIVTIGDIPGRGSGLGSSSSLAVGLVGAIYEYMGIKYRSSDAILKAHAIETAAGNESGYQDIAIAEIGGAKKLEYGYNKNNHLIVSSQALPIQPIIKNLILFNTDIERAAAPILSSMKTRLNTAVIDTTMEIAYKAIDAIIGGDLDAIGPLLDESWQNKKQYSYNITNGRIDTMYNAAIKAGATGGKICGAGGGGYLLMYCPNKTKSRVRKKMRKMGYRELKFKLDPLGCRVVYNEI